MKPTLEAALKQLRLRNNSRILWIDAVCINQEEDEEKNHQVPKMAQIFSQATRVCIWLGTESTAAKAFIDRIINFNTFDQLFDEGRNPEQSSSDWASLYKLMQRPWFNRRWVIQELALARKRTLYCGDQQIDWADFADAVSLFELRQHAIDQHFRRSPAHDHHPNYLGHVEAMAAVQLVSAAGNMFRKNEDGRIVGRLLDVEHLVSTLTEFKATDPKGTSASGLLQNTPAPPLNVAGTLCRKPNHEEQWRPIR